MRTKTPSEWTYRLGRGSSSSYFRQNPRFIELPRGTAGCLNRKCACFRRNTSCRRATKRPRTLSTAFLPLCASLFRVGGLESLVGCVSDAYLRGEGRGRNEFSVNAAADHGAASGAPEVALTNSTICCNHFRRHAISTTPSRCPVVCALVNGRPGPYSRGRNSPQCPQPLWF
jgi:hypothetical protein